MTKIAQHAYRSSSPSRNRCANLLGISRNFTTDELADLLMRRFGNGTKKYAGRYFLHDIIGLGAFGVVFDATDARILKRVVLKISCEENIWDLEREAIQLGGLASLSHHYFVRIYSNGYGDRIRKTTTFFMSINSTSILRR